MEQRSLQDLATANEQRWPSRRVSSRLRKHAKRKRLDCFTFVQRRTALILYTMGDFDKRPVVFYLLNLMRIPPHDAAEADKDGLFRVVEKWIFPCNDVELNSVMRKTIPGDAPFVQTC